MEEKNLLMKYFYENERPSPNELQSMYHFNNFFYKLIISANELNL